MKPLWLVANFFIDIALIRKLDWNWWADKRRNISCELLPQLIHVQMLLASTFCPTHFFQDAAILVLVFEPVLIDGNFCLGFITKDSLTSQIKALITDILNNNVFIYCRVRQRIKWEPNNRLFSDQQESAIGPSTTSMDGPLVCLIWKSRKRYWPLPTTWVGPLMYRIWPESKRHWPITDRVGRSTDEPR